MNDMRTPLSRVRGLGSAKTSVMYFCRILGFIDNPKNRLPRDDIGIRVRA